MYREVMDTHQIFLNSLSMVNHCFHYHGLFPLLVLLYLLSTV